MHPAIVQSERGAVFYWNVDNPVGLHGANQLDDVLFVQWCVYKLGKWDRIPADLRAVFSNAPISGSCTGREDDGLIIAIKALQRYGRSLVVDGRVTPPKGSDTYQFRGEERRYLIFYLNAVLRQMHPKQYPRIDLMPDFVWRIKDKATAPFI